MHSLFSTEQYKKDSITNDVRTIAMGSISILIAEDHTLLRESLALLLNRNPRFEVVGAVSSGEESVAMACRLLPHIVLMDIHLEGMSGFEATHLIRKQAPGTRVLVLSLHAQWPIARQILQKGAWGYMTKSSPLSELSEALQQVASGCRYICRELRGQLSRPGCATPKGISALTPREMEVIEWIRQGASSKEIACRLGVALRTVEAHRYNIFKKLNVGSYTALIELLHVHGMAG